MSMRPIVPILVLASAAALAPLAAPAQSDAGHAHAEHAQHAEHANHAEHSDHASHADHSDHAAHGASAALPVTPWATDAPLRENMRRIRRAVDGLAHYEHGHLNAAQAGELASTIQNAINAMFANCKLDAEADAALHGLLATFMTGAKAVQTEAQPPSQAIAQMREALARYPQMFNDPEWAQDE